MMSHDGIGTGKGGKHMPATGTTTRLANLQEAIDGMPDTGDAASHCNKNLAHWRPARRHVLLATFMVLLVCQTFMTLDVIADVFYIDIYLPYFDHTMLETVAVVAMGIGLIVIGRITWEQFRQNRHYREVVQTASGRLLETVNKTFDQWGLTRSEREVALLLMKGLSVEEIARIRGAKPGTIKSQSNAIYRKAGLKGRSELAAWFMEDLLAGEKLLGRKEAERSTSAASSA